MADTPTPSGNPEGPLAEALRRAPLEQNIPPTGQRIPSAGSPVSASTAQISKKTFTPRSKAWGFEWRSRAALFGIPLVHIAVGRDDQGRVRLARGIVAVGQFAIGMITAAQFGIGVIAGAGQVMLGTIAAGQFAFGTLLGAGQFATGYIAVGQFVLGYYGLGQAGWAHALWSLTRRDAAASVFFQPWVAVLGWRL